MGMDSFFSNLLSGADPARSARLRGGLLGAARAISQPYGNIGSAFVGAGMGAEDARQNYSQQQYQDLRMEAIKSTLAQDKAKRAALNNLFRTGGMGGQQQPSFEAAPQDAIAPAAPLQTEMPLGGQGVVAPQAQAQQQQPAFHLPAGFESLEQFQAYAAVDPEGAMKRMFPEQEHGLQSFAAGSHIYDKGTKQEVAVIPEKNNPNQPFNVDGTPNAAFQAYRAAERKADQAPQWANVAIARDNADQKKNGLIDPLTLDFMADQILAGDKSAYANIGRGAQGSNNIAALRARVARKAADRKMGGADLAALNAEFAGLQAGERTLGTRTANIEMAATEARNLMPLALEASNKVPRTQYPSLNKVRQAISEGTGDPNIVTLGVAVNGLINTYARAISPTGQPTVSDKEHARELLDKAWASGQFDAAVAQMDKEISAAQKSPGQVRGQFRQAISGREGVAHYPDAPSTPTPKSQMLPKPKTPADAQRLKPGTHFLDGNGVERVR